MKHIELAAYQLNFTVGGQQILKDISITLRPGTLTALIGPNGAGKSSLLRVLAQLETNAKGTITLSGEKPLSTLNSQEKAQTIGWLGSHDKIPFSFTAFEIVCLGRYPWHQGYPQKEDHEKSLTSLDRMGLTPLTHRAITTLSSGEQQKTMIARLLAGEAPILLMDEPLANLDVGAGLKLLTLLKNLTRGGATICLSIHDLPLAYRFADHVICLDKGSVVAEGPPEVIFHEPPVSRAFDVKVSMDKGLILSSLD